MRRLDFSHVLAGLAGMVLAMAGVGVFMFLNPSRSVNEQLAQTTQQAVESAEQARQESISMHAAISRYRLLGAGVGIASALGLAGLALWLAWRSEPETVEILDQHQRLIEEQQVLSISPDYPPQLDMPVDRRRLR